MEQASLFSNQSLSVGEITRVIQAVLESESLLQDIWVSGEISNLKYHTSGHIYFTLKDQQAALRCVMWKSHVFRLRQRLSDGMAVLAHGRIGVYERSGDYQLYVDAVQAAGEGWLYREFLRLKEALEAEGLFAEDIKKPIPALPQKIGIVTSPTGAALQDMLNTLRSRYPLAKVLLAPSSVQGSQAGAEISSQIRALQTKDVDLIILARGGGSIEDLWPFNEEQVVRAIRASQVPVVTGIGHETDFTLSDFAADLRAPTPTGAVVFSTPDRAELVQQINVLEDALKGMLNQQLHEAQYELNRFCEQLVRLSPQRWIEGERQHLDILQEQFRSGCWHQVQLHNAQLAGWQKKLEAVNPLAVLKRGFSLVEHADGGLVQSAAQVVSGETVNVKLHDGSFAAKVGTIHKTEEQ